jgi:hypothetical protein
MNVRHRAVTYAILLLLAFAISANAVDLKYDYDHHADFSRYKTYSWAKIETQDPLWKDRVEEASDKVLSAKGWNKVPEGGDVSIVAVGLTKEKPTMHTFYDGFDGWMWGGFGDETTEVENYTVGTLVVDMFDTSTKKLIWRGSASDVLADKPEKNINKLNKAVEKMFEHFPPPSKG